MDPTSPQTLDEAETDDARLGRRGLAPTASSDLKAVDRVRKQRLAVAHAEAAKAKRSAAIAKANLAEAKADAKLERAVEDLSLAEHGQKRSFWTGKIVTVRASRDGKRAHLRRAPRKKFLGVF